MALPALVAGAGLASRGLASYLAKNKAKKEMMKAGYGATRNASIPSLVSTQGSPGVFGKRLGLAGLGTGATMFGLNSTSNHPRNKAMDKRQEGTYMANPMMDKSQNPSYDASMTMDGQIQTMMEEMDGMGLSEDAKLKIIEDKLGFTNGFSQPEDIANTGTAMTSNEMKAATFDRIANDPSIPMDQRITAALRRETGAAFNPEEGIAMRAKIEAMDAERRNATGAGMTPNEMRMFMGIPQ